MANHRMFSTRIGNSAKFLQMPSESQLLYFHMVLRADDDGIVESYPLMKLLGLASDNFKVLLAKGFIEQLNEDQVVVINEWKEHNTIRADRKVNSIYLPLLLAVRPDAHILLPQPRSDVKNNEKRLPGQSMGSPWTAEGKLSKGKLSKVNRIPSVTTSPSPSSLSWAPAWTEFWDAYPRKVGKEFAKTSFAKIDPSLYPSIMGAVKAQKMSSDWKDLKYVPHASTWLNQKRWEDETASTDPLKEMEEWAKQCVRDNPGDSDAAMWQFKGLKLPDGKPKYTVQDVLKINHILHF